MKAKRKKRGALPAAARRDAAVRIIGGTFGGRTLPYSGRLETRPMRHRIREAVFNLVGPAVAGKHAVDLFAGTGALGIEALSRGAASATFVEFHIPSAEQIRGSLRSLGVDDRATVVTQCVFAWSRRAVPSEFPESPWLVFCAPPYDYYAQQRENLAELVDAFATAAPAASQVVVEADHRCELPPLPFADRWDVRSYGRTTVAILEVPSGPPERR